MESRDLFGIRRWNNLHCCNWRRYCDWVGYLLTSPSLTSLLTLHFLNEGYLLTSGAVLLLYISMCLHLHAFYEMFQHLMRKPERPNRVENHRKFICEVIRFHNSVKRWTVISVFEKASHKRIFASSWFMDTVDAYRPLLMFQLIANNMSTACIVFHMKLVNLNALHI